MGTINYVTDAAASFVYDAEYYNAIRFMISKTRYRFLANLFIIDVVMHGNNDAVPKLLKEIQVLNWRGKEVKLLIGGSRSNYEIAESSLLAQSYISSLGLSCAWYSNTVNKGSHTKFVVADNYVLVGSHNWSPGALSNQTQDSVLVNSEALANYLASLFYNQWNEIKKITNNVPD